MIRDVPRSGLGALVGLALLAAGPSACSDGPVALTEGEGRLEVAPTEVDLGRLFLGDATRAPPIGIRSVGTAPVGWSSRFVGPAAGFVLFGAEGRLPPGARGELTLLFRAERVGGVETQLEVRSGEPDAAPVTVRVTAEVLPVPDCEDGNGCTVDTFDRALGICRHEAQRLPCDDFNGCTVEDTCVEGVCLGRGTRCDDDDVCTDDLCDPAQGCVHRLRADCDDGNPCTVDTCDPVLGCGSAPVEDGTPCPDQDPCTSSEICLSGRCQVVQVPDGVACDDGNPCSTDDQCIDGTCRDPSYTPPGPGDLAFATTVGPLAPGSARNPLVGPDGGPVVGLAGGVVALDECGDEVWTATTALSPRFSAAVANPAAISVPVGDAVVDLDFTTGALRAEVVLGDALPPGPPGASIRILDMAARASGALVASVLRAAPDGAEEGFLVEVDPPRAVATLLAAFGPQRILRIAVDRDESLVLLLRDAAAGVERIVRLGIEGLAGGSWSTAALEAQASDLGLGASGEVYWTVGLTRIGAGGRASTLRSPSPRAEDRVGGPPVLFGPWVWSLETERGALVARTSTGGVARALPLAELAPAAGPVVDARGRIFVLDRAGVVHGFDADGARLFETPLEPGAPVEDAALALSPTGVLIAALGDTVYGIQAYAELALSPWPKHRRDNFGTGNR